MGCDRHDDHPQQSLSLCSRLGRRPRRRIDDLSHLQQSLRKWRLKLREAFFRAVENNIMIGNSFHTYVWCKNSGDVFRHNIVGSNYRPICVPVPWDEDINQNFQHQSGVTIAPAAILMKQSGRDKDSIVGDARFVDPARGVGTAPEPFSLGRQICHVPLRIA